MPTYQAADGTTLYFTDTGGDGVPLLCLAGLTRNHSDFDYVLPHLAGQRVIRLDYRGRGRSDWAAPESYTIPVEAQDALALLDHLNLGAAAILGTSRGGLIGMTLAALAKPRLIGLALNDIGPVIEPAGLAVIDGYLGVRPSEKTLAEAARMRAVLQPGFENVPEARWHEEVRHHYVQTPDGLQINYDPAMRQVFDAAKGQPVPDLWPLFDVLAGLPVCVIRGVNSNILSSATLAEMRNRRPDLIAAEIPGRGHVPFLDEPEALAALGTWLEKLE